MASLARSFLFPCARRSLVRPRAVVVESRAITATRFFTSSFRVRGATQAAPKAAKPPSRVSKPKTPSAAAPPASAAPQATPIAPSRYAFIKHLANKPTPTVLYEAPSHFWFYFGCWTSGLTLISWTVLTGPTVVNQPEGIPKWVGVVYGVAYVLIGCMGFYLIGKTPNIVKSIRVLPSAPAAASPRLEVSVKRMMPLLTPKVVTASLDKVALKSRFSLPDEYVPELKRLEHRREEEARRAELRRIDMTRLMTLPFRQVGRGFVNMFRGVRSAWTDMGLGHIRVDGKVFKVDVMRGFSHDGFRTLERLVKIGWK